MGRSLFDINNRKIFFDSPTKVIKIKTKINKCNLIKHFCTAEKTINKMKRQPSEWEKNIWNEATDKRLISKIHRQLMQLNIKKKKERKKEKNPTQSKHRWKI